MQFAHPTILALGSLASPTRYFWRGVSPVTMYRYGSTRRGCLDCFLNQGANSAAPFHIEDLRSTPSNNIMYLTVIKVPYRDFRTERKYRPTELGAIAHNNWLCASHL
jgi:hypothetical protein